MQSCLVTWVKLDFGLARRWPPCISKSYKRGPVLSLGELPTDWSEVRWVQNLLEFGVGHTHSRENMFGSCHLSCMVTLWGHKELKGTNYGMPPVLTSRIQIHCFLEWETSAHVNMFEIKLSLTWTCSWSPPTHVKTCSSALMAGLYLPPTRSLGRSSESFLEMFWSSARPPCPLIICAQVTRRPDAQPWLQHCGMYTDPLHGMDK